MPIPKYCDALAVSSSLQKNHGISLSVERLVELADAGLIPHARCDGGPPLFQMAATKEWIMTHLIHEESPRPFPRDLSVYCFRTGESLSFQVPSQLALIGSHLSEFPATFVRGFHCVYFLIKAGVVVYVGESGSLAVRLNEHRQFYDFDRAVFMRVPRSDAIQVEAMFIKALKPEHNKAHRDGCANHDYPAMMDRYCVSPPPSEN